MFWQRTNAAQAEAYLNRILHIMTFALSLAGKNKNAVVHALRQDLSISIQDAVSPEERTWPDNTITGLAVSFSLDFNDPQKVSQIQITGYGVIDNLLVCINNLEKGDPRSVNYSVDVLTRTRGTPKLSTLLADKLLNHPGFEALTLCGTTILKSRATMRSAGP